MLNINDLDRRFDNMDDASNGIGHVGDMYEDTPSNTKQNHRAIIIPYNSSKNYVDIEPPKRKTKFEFQGFEYYRTEGSHMFILVTNVED